MTNLQLYIAIGVPLLVNVLGFTLMGLYVTALDRRMTEGFAAVNQRFDDMRDLWRAELRRVEEVLDARLKHLEERRP